MFDEMLRIIREEEPPLPSTRLITTAELPSIAANRGSEPKKLSGLVKGELDWVVMKALDKDRNRRYETANSFAADVQRYLNDDPVQACPPSAMYRFCKFARRNKGVLIFATIIGAAILLTLVGLTVSTVLITRQAQTTSNALQAETLAKADLEQTLERERRDSYFHRVTLADRELSVNNLASALKLLGECPQDLREWEWYYLMRLCRVEPLVLRGETEVNSIAFSPDGERIASAGGDGALRIWNSKSGNVTQILKNVHNGFACSVAFHPDGKHLVSVGADKKLKVWDLTSGLPVFARPCDSVHVYGTAYGAAFSPDGGQVAAGIDGAVNVWDWRNDRLLHSLPVPDKRRFSVAFSPDGRRLASGNWWGTVQLWDPVAGGKPLCTFSETRGMRHPVCALAFSPDGARLATASFDRCADVWDTTTGELAHTLPHSGLVLCVAFSPDGRRIATAGEDKTVHVWDATTGREVLGLHGHTGNGGCVAFSPDGRRLASANTDGTIRIWDATELEGNEAAEILTFREHSDEIWSLAVSRDGQRVVSAGFSAPAKVWDPQTGRVSAEFDGHKEVVFCVAWQGDGRRIASAGSDGGLMTVKVWDAQSGQEVFALPAGPEYFAVAFSPDSRYIVTGRANRTVQVWDAPTGKEVHTLGAHDRVVRGIVFSSDGRHLASASADGIVKVWDATRLTEKQEPRYSLSARVHGPSLNVAFSPDGRRVATGGAENTVKIWDSETGQELHTLRGHNGDIYSVAFSPDSDGRWVASAGEDSVVNVWDSHSGKLLRSFRGHTGLVSCVAFSRDGRRLYSGSRDHTVKVWDVTQLEGAPDP
jgi:WD40 repeat protein